MQLQLSPGLWLLRRILANTRKVGHGARAIRNKYFQINYVLAAGSAQTATENKRTDTWTAQMEWPQVIWIRSAAKYPIICEFVKALQYTGLIWIVVFLIDKIFVKQLGLMSIKYNAHTGITHNIRKWKDNVKKSL